MVKFEVFKWICSLTAGTKYGASEPVFPAQDTDWEAVFPNGMAIKKDKTPNYVFVWKAWGEWSSSYSSWVREFLPVCSLGLVD